MSNLIIISQFWEQDRQAVVYKSILKPDYYVSLFQNDELSAEVQCHNKDINYAEDIAENWVARS